MNFISNFNSATNLKNIYLVDEIIFVFDSDQVFVTKKLLVVNLQ